MERKPLDTLGPITTSLGIPVPIWVAEGRKVYGFVSVLQNKPKFNSQERILHLKRYNTYALYRRVRD